MGHLDRNDLIIIYLSILLSITQWLWLKSEKKVSFLEGRNSVYADMIDNHESIKYTK